ncbi:MAG: hypothetical protein RIF46_10840, partial [Cyclobacteriaceae bacterium]
MENLTKIAALLWSLLILSGCNTNYQIKLMVPLEDEPAMQKIVDDINTHSRFEILLITEDSITEVGAIDKMLAQDFEITTVDNTLDYHKSK